MVNNQIDYIIGDSIKTLAENIRSQLIDKAQHTILVASDKETLSYKELIYNDRRVICTYSSKRARKDAHERQRLIDKANKWLAEPSRYKQVKSEARVDLFKPPTMANPSP